MYSKLCFRFVVTTVNSKLIAMIIKDIATS